MIVRLGRDFHDPTPTAYTHHAATLCSIRFASAIRRRLYATNLCIFIIMMTASASSKIHYLRRLVFSGLVRLGSQNCSLFHAPRPIALDSLQWVALAVQIGLG